ncbi:bifunctional Adenylate kinase [Babesia duncani]|uniref:Bifunctional Adenylate kinase n=1 Tax=Babesia duncani TaxID=323732 RepID=A0AAD9UPH1_9APIC|nr:bifunctional Adenylate kinase [Babesia duncani]
MDNIPVNLNPFLVFFGPPGVGKGTFSRLVAKEYNFDRIVTGDLLRREVALGTNLGSKVSSILSAGKYVQDELICDIVGYIYITILLYRNNIGKNARGIVFDGFPRTSVQVQYLKGIAETWGSKIYCMNLTLPVNILIKRLQGRRVCYSKKVENVQICTQCDSTYNVCSINDGEYVMEPLLPTPQDIQKVWAIS